MDIRKADSKGRITGFEPGQVYAFNREQGYYSKLVLPDALSGLTPPESRVTIE